MKMSLYKIKAIFLHQIKETRKNLQVIVLYMVYPVIAVVLTTSMPDFGGDVNYFIVIFATMHMVFTPLVSMTSTIAEEKEQNTLRMLVMSNVRPLDYVLGTGSFVFLCTQLGTCVFAYLSSYQSAELLGYVLLMMMGTIVSILLGIMIGLCAKTQSSANALTIPVAMILSFLPMLASFNETLKKISSVLYSQQLADMMYHPNLSTFTSDSLIVLGVNIAVVLGLFLYIFQKKGLE